MFSKREIADSIVKFISNDLLCDITSGQLKFVLCVAKKALHENPDILDGFLDSPIVANVIHEQDGEYDLDIFIKTLKNVLTEYETYSVVIPAIPMFAPKENVIRITANDIDKIMQYLNKDASVVTE